MSEDLSKIAFHKAFRQLIRPIVRMAIKRSVSVNDLYLWLKAIYVEEAENFTIENKKQSASRIALLTGLDRKEVTRIRKLNEDIEQLLQQQIKRTNRAVRALKAWRQEPEFSVNGKAQPLPCYGKSGSLQQLIQHHCGDVSVVTVLKEFEQAGLVEIDGGNIVTLKDTNYVPYKDDEALLGLLGQAGHDLLSTTAFNVEQQGGASRLQLSVAYNGMNKQLTKNLKKLIETDSYELLKKLDTWIDNELDMQKLDSEESKFRAGVGIYYFEESQDKESDQ